jgi:hypothetical protein
MCVLLTRAIHAPMLSTGRARPQKLFAQSCARTVDTNACVGNGDPALLGEVLHTLLSEINGSKGLSVLRFQALEDAMKTGADLVLEIRRWLDGDL